MKKILMLFGGLAVFAAISYLILVVLAAIGQMMSAIEDDGRIRDGRQL